MKVRYIKIIRIGKNIRLLAYHAILDTDTPSHTNSSPQTILHTSTCGKSICLILDTGYLDTCSINDLHAPGIIRYSIAFTFTTCYLLYYYIVIMHVIYAVYVCCGILLLRAVMVQVYKLV